MKRFKFRVWFSYGVATFSDVLEVEAQNYESAVELVTLKNLKIFSIESIKN